MAINLPIVTSFADKGLKSAKAAFANFKTDVGAATGAMGKFKAGSNAALSAVKANAGAFGMAAGTAIAGFAVKALNAFEDLAIASGKFADSTGLSVEQASRFTEVGGDIGIEAATIEIAIGKMNKVLGDTPELFKELGVEVVRSSGGVTDVNATFLNVIQRLKDIKDPAYRAYAASELLGRGWQQMAEMIAMGSTQITTSLNEVSNAKTITAEELIKAREIRAAKDRWKDMWEDLVLITGTAMADIALEVDKGFSSTGGFVDMMGKVAGKGSSLDEIYAKFPMLDTRIKTVTLDTARLADMYAGAYGPRIKEARDATAALTEELMNQEDGVAKLTAEWQTLLGTLDTEEAFANLEESLGAVYEAGIKAFGGGAEEVAKYEQEVRDHIRAIADLAIALDLTFGEQNKLKIFVDTEDLAAADEYLARINRGFGVDLGFGVGLQGARANGGPVSGGGASYLVGERGPEIFTPSSSGMITPNSAIGGGNTLIVNVQGADPQAVVRALQDYNRTAGPIPVNTRAN
mgnify:CR=1 FL=1